MKDTARWYKSTNVKPCKWWHASLDIIIYVQNSCFFLVEYKIQINLCTHRDLPINILYSWATINIVLGSLIILVQNDKVTLNCTPQKKYILQKLMNMQKLQKGNLVHKWWRGFTWEHDQSNDCDQAWQIRRLQVGPKSRVSYLESIYKWAHWIFLKERTVPKAALKD